MLYHFHTSLASLERAICQNSAATTERLSQNYRVTQKMMVEMKYADRSLRAPFCSSLVALPRISENKIHGWAHSGSPDIEMPKSGMAKK